MLYDANGFGLALGLAEKTIAPPTWMRVGVGMRDGDAVRALRDRRAAAGVGLVEECDEPDYGSAKCRDPGRLHRRGGMEAGAVNIDVQRDPCAGAAR